MSEFQDGLDENKKRYGWPVDPYRLLLFYKNRWHWLLIAITVGLLIGAIVAKTMVAKTYEASATLTLNPEYTDRTYQLDVQSMVDAILLGNNVDEVLKRLKLRIPRHAITSAVSTDFNPNRSSLLRINVKWPSADRVAEVANIVAEVFIEHQKKQIGILHEETVQNLQADLDIASARLSNIKQTYDVLRKEKGFSDINLEIQMAIQEASRLRFEADRMAVETNALSNSVQSAGNSNAERGALESGGWTPSSTDEFAELRAELELAQARLEAARTRLPPGHPTIRAMEMDVEKLQAQLPLGRRGRRGATVRQAYTSALTQQRTLESSAARAEARLKELAQDNGDVTSLLLDMSVAERHVEDLKLRHTQAADEARNPPLMFRSLAKATPPSYASKSRRKLVVAASGIGSLFLAVLGLFILANKGLRIYTASEAAFWSKFPVIGSSSWPKEPNMLQSLIRDLDDYAPASSGSTLVVSISDDVTERHFAQVVAQWLNQSSVYARKIAANPETEPPALLADNPEFVESFPIQMVPNPADEQTALARAVSITRAWTGPIPGPALRRAARLTDRVMVTLTSGMVSAIQLARLPTLLGRDDNIGLLLLGLDEIFSDCPDRVGHVEQFWNAKKQP